MDAIPGFKFKIQVVWRQLIVLFLLSRQFPQLAKEKVPVARKKDQSWLAARFSGSFKARALISLFFLFSFGVIVVYSFNVAFVSCCFLGRE
jgi:hypothetical protein